MGGTLGGAGADGLSDLIALAFPVSVDGSLPGQKNNDQPTVEAMLKGLMQDSPGWGSAHGAGYAGLPSNMPLVLGILAKLAEQITGLPITTWITMWNSDPTIGGLINVIQNALGSIFTVNVNLQSIWEGLDFNSPDFDIDAAWRLVEGFIPDWLETLIFGLGDAVPSEFPLTFPYTFGVETNVANQFFYWIRKFTGIDDFDDLFSLNIVDLITNFIETLLKPQDLLAWLVDGILPDGQAPQIVHDIIDAIVKGFSGIPIIGPVVQSVWDVINDLLGIGNDAQVTGTDNAAEIAKIKAGLEAAGASGVSITDDFDRPVAPTLGTAWTTFSSGAGGGTDGLGGDGYCHWAASGSSTRRIIHRHNTVLDSDIQYNSFVLRTAPENPPLSTDFVRRDLILRSDATMQNYVLASVLPTSLTLTPIVGGVTGTPINGDSGLVFKPGDFWEFFAGTAVELYRYMIKLNGRTVLDITDSGHITSVGASYRYHGFDGVAGVSFALIVPLQVAPPDAAAYAAADRTG